MSKLTKERVTLNGRSYELNCSYCSTTSYWKSNRGAQNARIEKHYGHGAQVAFLTVVAVENLLKVN